ncbi:MAG TPA: tetraacyldisaccharide 4'-kinase [Gammaproteobacteria bacterium]|nr:tetraacyldisaccharide 4'-kinase [Gammaproteobacteria bacterium]
MRGLSGWLLRRWYSSRPVWLLIPLAAVFGALAALRRFAYRSTLLGTASLPVPVLVVGNITVGGTGKTPFVLWLAEALLEQGRRPGIVTRGYGGQAQRWPQVVDAGSEASVVGDEAVLLASRSGLPVAAGPDRVAAARLLLEKHSADIIISDDGLQHYRLARVLEIALLDAERGLGNGWLLPAGPLREPSGRLNSVDIVVLKQSADAAFSWPRAVGMKLALEEAVNLADGRRLPLKQFAGTRVHALAAIGHPQQFFAGLRGAGIEVLPHALPDHALPSRLDLQPGDGLPVFMTEKDAVKCRHTGLKDLWYVPARAVIAEADRARVLEAVQGALSGPRP